MMTGTGLRNRIVRIAPLWWMMGLGSDTDRPASGNGERRGELPLAGRTVLVAEDEFFVGIELAHTLEAAGADIVGPAWSLEEAEKLGEETPLDMAVLDVNLNGDYALELAVALKNRGVRVVFATAHADDDRLFRGAAADIPRLSKPTSARALLRALLPFS